MNDLRNRLVEIHGQLHLLSKTNKSVACRASMVSAIPFSESKAYVICKACHYSLFDSTTDGNGVPLHTALLRVAKLEDELEIANNTIKELRNKYENNSSQV